MLLLPVLLACSTAPSGQPAETAEETGDVDTAGDDTADSTGEDTSETGETGESGDSGGVEDCATIVPEVVLSPVIPTVFTATWTTAEPGTSVIEWGYAEGDYPWQTAEVGDDTTDHAVVVAGPAPGTTVHWRAVTRTATQECVSHDKTAAIGDDGTAPTSLKLSTATNGATSGFRVMPLSSETVNIAIIDDLGMPVWWFPVDRALNSTEAMLDQDGAHVLFLVEDRDRSEDIGGIMRVSLDRMTVEFYPLSNIHHAFVQLPDGGFVYLAADPRTFEGFAVAGDQVVRVDAKGQNPEILFSTWDHWTPDLDAIRAQSNAYYPLWLDWTHGNGLSLREDGSLLVSFHNVSAVVNLELDGTLRWTLGGEGDLVPSDFSTDDAGRRFEIQHSPVEVPGGILMFDNGSMTGDGYSEAVEYALDENSMTYTRAWSYDWGRSEFVMIMGDVQRLDNDNTLVTWGDEGLLTEVTPDGQIVWALEGAATAFGFMELVPTVGGPSSL